MCLTEKQAELANRITESAHQNSLSWWRHLLLASSSIDAVLISLHAEPSQHPYIRLVFLLSIGILSLGILLTAIVLYNQTTLPVKGFRAYMNNILYEHDTGRRKSFAIVKPSKVIKTIEIVVYILFSSFLVLMFIYAWMREYA